MKILQVIAIFQRSAGTSVFCAESARQLAKLGHEVAIAVPDTKVEGLYPTPDGVRLVAIAEAMQENWDVVHIHGIWTPILTRVQRWATANKIKLVWSPHGMLQTRALMMKWLKKFAGLLLYQWKALRSADVIHVCSDSEARNVARLHLGVPMVKIPLGVHLSGMVEGNASRDAKDPRQIVLYVGRVNRGKGLGNLIKAWKTLCEKDVAISSSWRVVIAGFDEENHAEELKTLAKRLSVEDSIEVRGPVYGSDKDSLYASASLFVLPSLSENFGSVILEALAQGVPAIATNGTPWQDLPRVGCGWCVDIGAKPLAGAIGEAIGKPSSELKNMGMIGQKWVRENFSWTVVGEQVEELYYGLKKESKLS